MRCMVPAWPENRSSQESDFKDLILSLNKTGKRFPSKSFSLREFLGDQACCWNRTMSSKLMFLSVVVLLSFIELSGECLFLFLFSQICLFIHTRHSERPHGCSLLISSAAESPASDTIVKSQKRQLPVTFFSIEFEATNPIAISVWPTRHHSRCRFCWVPPRSMVAKLCPHEIPLAPDNTSPTQANNESRSSNLETTMATTHDKPIRLEIHNTATSPSLWFIWKNSFDLKGHFQQRSTLSHFSLAGSK